MLHTLEMKNNISVSLTFYFLLFVGFVLILPTTYHGDQGFWKHWAIQILENGISQIYHFKLFGRHPVNYHPVWLYLLAVFGKIQGSPEAIIANLNSVKAIPLAFDFIAATSLIYLFKNTARSYLLPLGLLLNIAFLYNSIIWGQIDTIYTTFTLLAFIFAFHHRQLPAMLCFLLALNTKLQAIVFAPILFIVLAPGLSKDKKRGARDIVITLSVQLLILLPFWWGGTLGKLGEVLFGAMDFYPFLSLNAFNIWHLLFGHEARKMSDAVLFSGLSYKQWGLIGFAIVYAISCAPLCIKTFFSSTPSSHTKGYQKLVMLTLSLCALAFFFFNTQMHERYSHPCILLSFVYGCYRKNWTLYLICSLAYFLNLERAMKAFKLGYYDSLLFDSRFVASLFGVAILYGIYELYRLTFRRFQRPY